MVLDVIGIGDFFQGRARVAFLSTRLAPGFFTEAFGLGFGRIGEVAFVRRRRLAAGSAVTLQFGDAGFVRLDTIPQLENKIGNGLGVSLGQGDEFFSGRALHRLFYGLTMLKLS